MRLQLKDISKRVKISGFYYDVLDLIFYKLTWFIKIFYA